MKAAPGKPDLEEGNRTQARLCQSSVENQDPTGGNCSCASKPSCETQMPSKEPRAPELSLSEAVYPYDHQTGFAVEAQFSISTWKEGSPSQPGCLPFGYDV